MYTIYKVSHIPSSKVYIGVTKRPLQVRWRQHLKDAYHGVYDFYFHNALRKHGREEFTIEVIFECSDETSTFTKEKEYIKQYVCLAPNGYNSNSGGIGQLNPSKQTRQKMRDAKLGKYTGSENPGAKTFLIQSPRGQQFSITGTISRFCKEHGIYHQALLKSYHLHRPIIKGKSKGWVLLKNESKSVD